MVTSAQSTRSSGAPPRPSLGAVSVATATAAAALLTLVALGSASGHMLLIPPMAASMALIAGAPSLPLSQPRNVVGGQVISALVGVGVGLVSHSLWAAALSGGLALGAMLFTRTAHSPAAATAVIGVLAVDRQVSFVVCAGLAAAILVLFGLVRAWIGRIEYPIYWW